MVRLRVRVRIVSGLGLVGLGLECRLGFRVTVELKG